jgi:hypothetical protein
MNMESVKFWDVMLQRLIEYKSEECRFLGCYDVFLRRMLRLLVTADVVPTSPILVALMVKAIRWHETSVLTRLTRPDIPDDGILHSYRREKFKC